MSFHMDKLGVDAHTHEHKHKHSNGHTHTDAGNDNTQRPKLALGNKTTLGNLTVQLFDRRGVRVNVKYAFLMPNVSM